MNNEQKVAYINAQVASMLAEMEGMKAANTERERDGFALAYDEKAFSSLPAEYGVDHNSVVAFFQS